MLLLPFSGQLVVPTPFLSNMHVTLQMLYPGLCTETALYHMMCVCRPSLSLPASQQMSQPLLPPHQHRHQQQQQHHRQ